MRWFFSLVLICLFRYTEGPGEQSIRHMINSKIREIETTQPDVSVRDVGRAIEGDSAARFWHDSSNRFPEEVFTFASGTFAH